jgi:DNA polymerase V
LWALADCNNFFASCEKLFRPDLADRPVVVLSNNDGCIVARSREAKALGIPMGAPEFKVRDLLKKHKVEVFSSNYVLYGDMSARVFAALEHVCPAVEQYSIDEAFVRFDGALLADPLAVARAMRETALQWTGITVSVGVGATRTLAKIAGDIAKKGDGVCLLPAPDAPEMETVLRKTPVADIWGIGRRLVKTLWAEGVTSAFQLRNADEQWVRRRLTVSGWKTVLELRGIPCINEDDAPAPRRTLVSSRSFAKKVYDRHALEEAVSSFTARAAERLRREKLTAGGIAVSLRTSRHIGRDAFYAAADHAPFLKATADTGVMLEAARRILDRIYRQGPAYAKAGVMLYDLAPRSRRQSSLFDAVASDARREELMAAMDSVNRRFGRGSLRFGAEGPAQGQADWRMRQERRSPRMTTDWNELPKARCR